MRGLPLTCGETPWSPDGTSHSTRQHSTQQQAQFAALHSLHSPAVSHARASLCLLSSNFLTPERIFFSSPATSWRQSESSSLLQQLLDARANLLLFSSNFLRQSDSSSLLQRFSNARSNLLLFSSDFLRQSDSSSLLQRFPTPERFFFSSVFTLQKFLLSSLFLVVWMMPSPYSPSSFTLQSPDCSGIFLPDAFLSRFHGNHFSPGVILRTFCRTFSLHRLFLLVLRRLVTSPSGRNHHSWVQSGLEGAIALISDLVLYLASFSLFEMTPPPAKRIFFSPHGALAFELMSAWSRVVGVILVAG